MAASVKIFNSQESSMGGGSWQDQIFCTRRKDGSFSLRARQVGDEGPILSPAGKTRIRSPAAFVKALREIGDLLDYEFDNEAIEECCERIIELDQEFARKIKT